MSADNGYILRKRAKDEKFVLQMYFASNDGFPNIDSEHSLVFDSLEEAVLKYEQMDSEWPYSEYGLTTQIKDPV
jgi:hypothetical protein